MNIMDIIYESLYDDNHDEEDTYSLVRKLDYEHKKQYRDDISSLRKENNEFQRKLEYMEKRANNDVKKIENETKIREDEKYFRQHQNDQLKNLWYKNESKLKNFDYNKLYDITEEMSTVDTKRKLQLLENSSVKLCLACLNDKFNIPNLNKKFYSDFLNLNNKFHPKMTPKQSVIDKITELKNILQSDPVIYKDNTPSIETINMSLELKL